MFNNKRCREVEDGKIYDWLSHLLNNLNFGTFLKEERDWDLMTSLSSELKNSGRWQKGENFLAFLDNNTLGVGISCIVRVEVIALGEIVIKGGST